MGERKYLARIAVLIEYPSAQQRLASQGTSLASSLPV
jgi:hypothetical protein